MARALLILALFGLPAIVFAADPKPGDDPVAPPETFSADQRSHWAYQAAARLEPPEVKDRTRVKNPIDRFILAGIEETGFDHAPEADRIALIGRVTFDLLGLPPAPDVVDAFLNDHQANAHERLVDRLLSSLRYGERWAQHWSDLARYADSNGFELDVERPDVWRCRDRVVKALNDDLPYDRFLTLQLVGADAFSNTDIDASRRLVLTRSDNPATARVIVSRLRMRHVGRGIVATPNDFGIRGDDSFHPKLLAQGWRLKPIHRLIATPATNRQSPRFSGPSQTTDDSDNSLVWKMNRRLEAESLRDAMPAVSCKLNPKMGGPGVLVPIEKEVEALIFTEVVDLWPETPDPAEHARRSLCLFRLRNVRYPMFDAFDAPDTQTACVRRTVSTRALQPPVLLNSAFAFDRAKNLAGCLIREAGDDPEARVERAYQFVLARPPLPEESSRALAFLSVRVALLRHRARNGQPLAQPTVASVEADAAVGAALMDFALAMLNQNELAYI